MAQSGVNTVREAIIAALEQVKYNLPDGKARSMAYTKLEEALLWSESEDVIPYV